MTQSSEIIVIGAGIVGVSAAYQLLRRGRAVTLIDRRGPGEETSYGNAGVIIGGVDVPVAMPRDLREIARIALNRTTYLRHRPGFLPKIAPWLWQFWRATEARELEHKARLSASLFAHSISSHKELAGLANAENLLRDTGWVQVFAKESGLGDVAMERRLADEFGVDYEVLDKGAISDLEPSLKSIKSAGVWWKNITSTSDPGGLTKAYAEAFVAAGGTLIEEPVEALLDKTNARWRVLTPVAAHEADDVVVAAGAWSTDLLRPLGYRFPFAVKRGYHMHFAPQGNAGLSRPVVDSDYGFVLAPMQQGIRVTTGVEFDDRDAPPSSAQLERVLPYANALFPLAEAKESDPWLGRRPCFPDQLPMIGKAPRHEGLWFDFGHAHWGLTLGPASGRLLADMMCGDDLSADPTAFAPTRYRI